MFELKHSPSVYAKGMLQTKAFSTLRLVYTSLIHFVFLKTLLTLHLKNSL